MASAKKWVALLRAVLPATHKKMSMQDLRTSCEKMGLENVSTHAASGNLLFSSALPKAKLQILLAEIIADYDLNNHVVLRTTAQLKILVKDAPLLDAAIDRPSLVLVYFYDNKVSIDAVDKLNASTRPERIEVLGRELYVDYKDGIGRSKLTSAVIERHLGQPGTARNWNAVNKLINLSS